MNTFIIAAISIDGFIAQAESQISTSWTSKADKKFFSERTKQAGVIVMGSTTYKTIGRPLPGRLNIVYSRDLNPPGEQAENLRFTQADPRELITQLAAEGYSEVAICGGASIYSMFMKAGVVDTLYLTLEPVIFGSGIKLFQEGIAANLTLTEMQNLTDQTLLLSYKVLI